MRHTASNLMHQLITAVLVVCVSTCCCQAGLVLHGAPGPDASGCADGAVSSCCAKPDPAPSDEPTEPGGGCAGCCIKGTGLKDGTVAVPQPMPVATPALGADAMDLLPRWDAFAFRTRDAGREPFVSPRSLVHLHCALIV